MKRKLIFLYGYPGIGKLTIAKELSKLISVPIYHSHLTSDLVYSVFPRGKVGSQLKHAIRKLVVEQWAQTQETSLIMTLLYKKGKNEAYFTELSEIAEKNSTDVYYFQLTCSMEELKRRLVSEERKKYDKLVNWDKALEKMEKEDMSATVPFSNNHSVDTSGLSPLESAGKIRKILQR